MGLSFDIRGFFMRPATIRKGSILGKYRLEARLGEGSFGSVWKARDTVEDRHVALKVVWQRVEEEFGRRSIEREAQIAARLDHPNIVALRNADWIDGFFVLANDLARCNLNDFKVARRSASVGLRVIRELVAGLAHAHARQVMHLDLKPGNVMIFNDGRAAIGDFGTSRITRGVTRTYQEAGTLGYMAPEQAYGHARKASDVFALGLIAFELLAGKLLSWPFSWPPAGFDRFQSRVPTALQTVLRKAASFQPRARYRDGIELQHAFERAWLASAKVEASPGRVRRKPVRALTALELEASRFKRAHGARLGMRYLCYRCEGPIAESMKHCPWCGAGEHSFRDVSSRPLVCYACERGVEEEWNCCPWCYPGRFESNGRPPRHGELAERACGAKGCDGRLEPFMSYCPQCKQKPRRVWSDPQLKDRCPGCRWPVSRESWRFCPWCGRREPRAGTFGAGGTQSGR